jgi:hypothetical protein
VHKRIDSGKHLSLQLVAQGVVVEGGHGGIWAFFGTAEQSP